MIKILRLLATLLLILSLSSCVNSERIKSTFLGDMELSQFRDIDFEQLQKTIDSSNGINDPMDVLEMNPHRILESSSETTAITQSYKSKFGNSYLFYKRENLNDDSYNGITIWMEYDTSITGNIEIIELKESFQCKDGRGHQEWSAKPCN